MPGRRNAARERAKHAATAAARLRHVHAVMVAEFPEYDRALIDYPAILGFLDRFGIRRRNGRPVTIRMLTRWRREFGFPVCKGVTILDQHWSPPVSSTVAIAAWICAQLRSSDARGFRVVCRAAA